eukprot:scaffold6058_cov96-Cylindrotheca_fusiformis.AAC.8
MEHARQDSIVLDLEKLLEPEVRRRRTVRRGRCWGTCQHVRPVVGWNCTFPQSAKRAETDWAKSGLDEKKEPEYLLVSWSQLATPKHTTR